jgi:signal transduction histidine kinase
VPALRLAVKLPALVVSAVLLTAAVGAFLAISIGRGVLRQAAVTEVTERREIYANAVEFYLDGARSLIAIVGDLPRLKEFSERWLGPAAPPAPAAAIESFRQTFARPLLRDSEVFEYLLLLKADGTVYLLEPGELDRHLSHQDLSFSAWYRDVMRTRSLVVSDLNISPVTQRPTVVIAVPVLDSGGRIVAVWAGALRLVQLSRIGSSASSPGAARPHGYLTDRRGLIIAHQTNPSYVENQTDFSSVPPVRDALAGGDGAGPFYNPIEAEEKLGAYRQLPKLGWAVVYAVPASIALAPVNLLNRGIVLTSGVVAALVGLLAFIMARRISGPIGRLTAAAETIGTGDFGQRIEVRMGDEIGALGHAFNRMAVTLAEKEAQLRQRAEELQAANSELEAFSYSVSHDLRAPLRAMDGFARILMTEEAGALSPTGHRHLNLVRENARQMGHLIDDLLSFARLGRQSLKRQAVEPAELVQQALESLEEERHGRQVEVLMCDLKTCAADPALLRQVWVNLLTNALKFTRQREVARIEIGCQPDGDETIYFVKDNGVGFDMRYAHKLFGVFQRLHRAEEYEGTGVGLAIVQRVIHRHGGRVWAEAEEGRGASFYFTLPRSDT